MRKLKLVMQITVDGFVAREDGSPDWMAEGGDPEAVAFAINAAETSDVMLMGRKLSEVFMKYWESVTDGPEYEMAKRMVKTPKIIFSKTIKSADGKNVRVENGDLKTEVMKMKNQPGKDILVYGGADFVSNLIKENLMDEYNLVYNPTAIGTGLRIFGDTVRLKMTGSRTFNTGEVLITYVPK